MKKTLKPFSLGLFLLSFLSIFQTTHASDPIYTGKFNNRAVQGYDVVSYFQGDGTPKKGSKEFTTEWNGADWHFVSEENLSTFVANPVAYAPQYGGYCAWAIANDKLAKGDARFYTVLDGKLYLNFNKSIDAQWKSNKQEFIRLADTKYPELID